MPKMSLGEFASHLDRCASQMGRRERDGLRSAGLRIRDAARGYIGEYQGPVPPFPAWRPLAEATKADRAAQGYAPDEPLLRTGELRASIKFTVLGRRLDVWSDSDIAKFQEFGTASIPPRAFIGRSMAERGAEEARTVARAAFAPLLSGRS